MHFTHDQIEFAASLIGHIDSGEKDIFLNSVNTINQIEAEIFYNGSMSGVFFSSTFYKGLRIHISFEKDTDQFNEELAKCVRSALKNSGMTSCSIWIRNENRKIIEYLKTKFRIPPIGKYYYASIEFIMRRDNFVRTTEQSVFEIRSYEEKHIDSYLGLLDNSMTFADPTPNFIGNKDHYLKYLADRGQNDSFEAFWKCGELIGLYWRKNAEIDFFAIAADHQRKGYGTIMLTRAIEMVFKNTEADFAYLYAVDWNEKGQSFYKKYGMEQNGHSYGLQINDYTKRRKHIPTTNQFVE